MSGCGLRTLACALGGLVALATAPAAFAHHSERPVPATPDAARGLVFRGLERAPAGGRCEGAFQLRTANGKLACTHGPDPAPRGVDVRDRRSTKELRATDPATVGAATPTASSPALEGGAVHCIGDGTSGNRVHAIYAYQAGGTDRYEAVLPSIRGWAADVDAAFEASAAETGGSRHVRFVTDGACELVVDRVAISAAAVSSFSTMIDELAARGYTASNRKYLVWVDANVYCGIALQYVDDTPEQDNLNNGRTGVPGMFARVDNGCWGYAETHELVHTIGGVQNSAPNASGYGHCTDESDQMCYVDAPGVVMRQLCPLAHEDLLDCNHDDYFHTSPDAASYLATHWNTASSSFLAAELAAPGSDTTGPAVTAPTESFGTSVARATLPVTLAWGAGDVSGVAAYRLWQSTDGGAYTEVALPSPTTTSAVRSLSAGHRYRFRVEATDTAGNTSSAEGASFVVRTHQETASAIRYTAKWTRGYWTYALGSYQRYATGRGQQARFSFTGRTVAWIGRMGPTSGKAYVYVDDAYVRTVDLWSSSVSARRVLFTRSWSTPGAHTLTVVVAGTAGRPRVDIDAFTVLS